MGAGHSSPVLRVVPSESVLVGSITVQRHEYEFALVREALRDFLVHGIGNRAAARMAHDEDLVRCGRYECGDHRIELAGLLEDAEADVAIGIGRAAWPEAGAELDAGLLLLGASHPSVHVFRFGLVTAEENSTHLHLVGPPSGEAETSTVPSTEPWRLLTRKSVQRYGCRTDRSLPSGSQSDGGTR